MIMSMSTFHQDTDVSMCELDAQQKQKQYRLLGAAEILLTCSLNTKNLCEKLPFHLMLYVDEKTLELLSLKARLKLSYLSAS